MKLAELASQRASETLVGRQQERQALSALLGDNGPVIAWIHGIAGVGKSALLDVFLTEARQREATVVRLDARAIEPTERGFIDAVSDAIGGAGADTSEIAARLGRLGSSVIVAVDNYELLRLLDTWLRQAFVPLLPSSVRLILVGREAPVAGWLETPGWSNLFLDLRLKTLSDAESEALLDRLHVDAAQRPLINRIARGHPLALTVAAAATRTRPSLDVMQLADEAVFDALTRLYLHGLDPATRLALDAASVVRRTTMSLLAALLPERAPQDAFERLAGLPFAELAPDGLVFHAAVQKVVAAALKSTDPLRHRRYRLAAWRQLRTEVRTAGISDLWRYTADLLYLIENPVVREAFFPSSSTAYAVEPARPDDFEPIADIIHTYQPATLERAMLDLWGRMPGAFRVTRDPSGAVAGFYVVFEAQAVSPAWLGTDPLMRAFWRHLRESPIPPQQRTLFAPYWLARDGGEKPGPVQAASWLDLKRYYMELRPSLRRVYSSLRDPRPYGDVLPRLGFRPFPGSEVAVDGVTYYGAVNDFGASSIDGWLSWLLAGELGVDQAELLALPERQLVLDGQRIDLTRLEFDVMQLLYEHEGKPVPRRIIMEAVWGHDVDTASNVLEAVVKSLRKKMGEAAAMIETVRGVGYRLQRPAAKAEA